MTLGLNDAYTLSGSTPAQQCDYAWGLYRDVDISSSTTDLPAYSAGYSNSWMVHKTGTLAGPSITAFAAGGLVSQVTLGNNDFQYRRYDLNLRRYKRVMDSANDTLILSVENNSGLLPPANAGEFSFSFYFRMLLLE